MNLERFFMCEVFFFGTAFNNPSQMSPRSVGRFRCIAEGIENDNAGRRGCDSCLEKRVVDLEVDVTADAENRGRKEERMEVVVA
jgi:hypothetical protein